MCTGFLFLFLFLFSQFVCVCVCVFVCVFVCLFVLLLLLLFCLVFFNVKLQPWRVSSTAEKETRVDQGKMECYHLTFTLLRT